MKVGLFSIGIGTAVHPEIIRATAAHAERVGFATLWVGEHVVLFDRQGSKYPYSAEGDFPLPGSADWLDPFLALTFAAAATSKIRLATGICLVPEHNPVVLAKQAATLDRLAGGRFVLGVGIGWSAEEFAALGIPFESTLKDIPFVRLGDRNMTQTTFLKPLTGEFQRGPLTAVIAMKGDNALTLTLPGQPVYNLVPVRGMKFNIKELNGYSVEFKGDDLVFYQPRGTFAASRKK